MIEIIRKDRAVACARYVDIQKYTVRELQETIEFWESTGNHEVNIYYI